MFFGAAVGCLTIPEPAAVFREVQALRDKAHWYGEIKWIDLTLTSLPLYKRLVDIFVASDARFACFVADRTTADPVKRFKSDAWLAYQSATQLLIGSSRPGQLLSVIADNYSTPVHVRFEENVRKDVNGRHGELNVTTVCRMDSRACDGLQMVDVLTGAVTFEHRQQAKLAGTKSAKAKLAKYLRTTLGVSTWTVGHKDTKINVANYSHVPAVAQSP